MGVILLSINLIDKSTIIHHFIKDVFPFVKKELQYWKSMAENIPDPVLSQQAIDSIEKKAFHCQGGSIYSLYTGKVNTDNIRFIVALQTISDYLDNLCDRVTIEESKSLFQLHMAVLDALDPNSEIKDYYAYYPHANDGGYLKSLVNTCRKYLLNLPSYNIVSKDVLFLGKLYSEMQSLKHIKLSERNNALEDWANIYLDKYPEINTWEFSAASGSTLGVFLLCTLAEDENLTKKEVDEVVDAYFPWVCGLHILLDYFIDQREDILNKDLNFVSFYNNDIEKKERLLLFLSQSFKNISNLDNPNFHELIIEGLLAMYLSDEKAFSVSEKPITLSLIKSSPMEVRLLHQLCLLLRKRKTIL